MLYADFAGVYKIVPKSRWYFNLQQAQAVGLGPWNVAEHGPFRGTYTKVPYRNTTFVIVYNFERVNNASGFSESIISIPKEWISTCWKFVACPDDDFYFTGCNPKTDNPKFRALVNDRFLEFPVSKYAKLFGCKYFEI